MAAVEGKPQRPDQWHVTLEFLGAGSARASACAASAAGRVRSRALAIEFDRLEHWRKPQVVCLVASRVPARLATLVTQLRAALAEEGFTPEARDRSGRT